MMIRVDDRVDDRLPMVFVAVGEVRDFHLHYVSGKSSHLPLPEVRSAINYLFLAKKMLPSL